MGMAVGLIEVIILVIMLVVIAMIVRAVIGGRRGSVGGDVNRPHPQLRQCPGCGARIENDADFCPQCGLRIST